MSQRDIFMVMVDDALYSMIFSPCWDHSVLVDIEDESRFSDQLDLYRKVTRRFLQRAARRNRPAQGPYKQRMSMFELLSCCMEGAKDLFGVCSMPPPEVPQMVGAFMWTAIDGRPPWTGAVSVRV
jgi:hypothetical protein